MGACKLVRLWVGRCGWLGFPIPLAIFFSRWCSCRGLPYYVTLHYFFSPLVLQRTTINTFYFYKKFFKTSAVSTTDLMVETQLCKLRGTSDTFVGRAYSIPGIAFMIWFL